MKSSRTFALLGVALSVMLLLPGLFLPVLSIRGRLNPDGVADLTHRLLEQGVSDSTVAAIRPIINPGLLPLVESQPNGLKNMIVATIETQLVSELKTKGAIEVYSQTRSIVGSVRHLYSVGSNAAATLILLFSIIVPLLKSFLVCWGVLQSNPARRQRTLSFVEAIAKWSMADVFAVAVIIAFLAAQATQTLPGETSGAILSFEAVFGSGFFWFAGYCLTSLFVQQATARWLIKEA